MGIKKITLPCTITLTRIAPRSLDYDNLLNAFKNIRDVIADYIIPGQAPGRSDSDSRINWLYSQEKGQPKTYNIRITIQLANNK